MFFEFSVDEETQKKKVTEKPIEKSYEEECFTEVHRSSKMIYHFDKKGTTLEGLTNTKCGFDDNYYRVQCPDGLFFLLSYKQYDYHQ